MTEEIEETNETPTADVAETTPANDTAPGTDATPAADTPVETAPVEAAPVVETAPGVEATPDSGAAPQGQSESKPSESKPADRFDKKKKKVKGFKELERLADFATKSPDIGTTVAELAYKIGANEIGNRVTRMGL